MLSVILALVIGVALGVLIAGVIASRRHRPVTESAGAPEATSSSENDVTLLLGEAVDNLEIGVVIAAPSGTIVYRNATAAAFTGTHSGLLLDGHLSSLFAQTRAGESAQRLVDLHGPPRSWWEIAADPLPNGGAVATIRDVSERMRTDVMRTDFVTNVSHELKTPVGAVAVLAEALIDETDPEIVHRLADHLVEESHRAVRTIDDLLELSQIESTRPGDAAVDLISVVKSAIGRGKIVDGGRGVKINTLDMPESLWIRGDERQLVSAVGNLVENAVKYSHPGDVVQVRTRADDNAVEVMVADQGVGYPEPGPGPGVRALLPRRQGAQPRDGRNRTRAVDRASRRHEPRRQGAGLVDRGRGFDVRAAPSLRSGDPPDQPVDAVDVPVLDVEETSGREREVS